MGSWPTCSMYNEMVKHSFGLLPWKKHWSHPFLSPNKPYEYAHAGLYVLCTSSLTSVINELNGNCTSFDNYDDLLTKLLYFKENLDDLYKKRIEIFDFAQKNLFWEMYEENILQAYKLA